MMLILNINGWIVNDCNCEIKIQVRGVLMPIESL